MKKGCFFSFLTILTISLGVVFYISKKHISSVDNFIKPWVIDQAKEEFDKTIISIKSSPEKDSLNAILSGYLKSIKNDKNFKIKDSEKFFEELHFAIRDTEINSNEISRLKDLFNKHITTIHERQTKNPD